jgi:hypothetical protein
MGKMITYDNQNCNKDWILCQYVGIKASLVDCNKCKRYLTHDSYGETKLMAGKTKQLCYW